MQNKRLIFAIKSRYTT